MSLWFEQGRPQPSGKAPGARSLFYWGAKTVGHLVLRVALLDSNSNLPLDGICWSLMRSFKDWEPPSIWACSPATPSLKVIQAEFRWLHRRWLSSPCEHLRSSMLHSASGDCFSALWLFLNCILFSVIASHGVLLWLWFPSLSCSWLSWCPHTIQILPFPITLVSQFWWPTLEIKALKVGEKGRGWTTAVSSRPAWTA